ncbi:MAG: glycosyltransferase family 2 protein [bacterium]
MTVHAVIVTHDPNALFEEALAAAASQVDHVFVVDNATTAPTHQWICDLVAACRNASLIQNRTNLGLATALNKGVRAALREQCDWVLTLDQDSVLLDGAVAGMERYPAAHCAEANVGIVAPRVVYRGKAGDGRAKAHRSAEYPDRHFVEGVITSGNLVRGEVFERVGLYCDAYFIDYVDYEFCLRVRAHGYRIAEASDAVLHHAMGEVVRTKLLGMDVQYTRYSPIRKYYKARNRILTYRKHMAKFPGWVLRDSMSIPWEVLKTIVVEERKLESLGAMLRGTIDGVLGWSGDSEARSS